MNTVSFGIDAGRVTRVVLLVLLFAGTGLCGHAQPMNSWIAPASGNWDDASPWSMGVRPDSSQSVLITNEGWKAVAINASTPLNFPGSMTVDDLTISGDTNSHNVLLLNYAGTATPLTVLNSLSVETNGQILLLYSGVNVNGAAHVGGVFDEEGGEFTFTNSASTTLRVEGGTFNLTNGSVAGANMYLGGTNAGYFNQDSGLVSLASLSLSSTLYYLNDRTGHYLFQSGWLEVGDQENVGGTLTQNGGTNSASVLSVTSGTYTKNGGALFAGEVLVDPPSGPLPPDATLTQTGGSAVITNDLHLFSPGGGPHFGVATFNMAGGSLSAESMLMENASGLYQSDGTVSVATEIALSGAGDYGSYGQYLLSGGNLGSSNIVILSQGFFEQTGGTLTVTNLSISGLGADFQLRGGAVTAKSIALTGNLNDIQPPLLFVYNAPSFLVANEAISLAGGVIVLQDSAQQFGRLTLQSDSGISLAGGSAILQFDDSHANSWNGQLKVYNWSGSTNGGGADQLIFGTSSSALAPVQVGQIQFINPAGLASGTYAGRILSTGEVVPDAGSSGGGGGALVNNWTNPASAKWEDPYWSLGILPAADQTVNITNDGYKAVNIDSTTVSSFPTSLTVSNLFVSAPSNALSTVLLNYAGLGTPLKVLNNCVIGTNGTIDNFASSFEVDGNGGGQLLVNGGTFTQVGGQTVVNAPVLVSSGGSLNATNGNLTLGNVTLGTTNSSGTFDQDGGSIAVQRLSIQSGGYTLYSGVLYAIGGTELDAFGGFLQWGGTNYGDITVNAASSGAYTMDGGLAKGNVLTIPGSFYQGGGLVDMQTVDWTGNNGNVLSDGTLRSGSINIHAGALVYMGQGGLTAGTVETGSLSISNSAQVYVTAYDLFITNSVDIRGNPSNNPAVLMVTGNPQVGTILNVGTITMGDNSVMEHGANATTELSSGLSMAGGHYILNGGLLEGPYVGVGANGTFAHFGGTNLVHGVLSISGAYNLAATLLTDGIFLRGSLLLEDGTFANSGLIDLGGYIGVGVPDGSGGQVRLSTNAVIEFIGTATTRQLHFAASSAVDWTPGALLVISNWNNSGTHLFFGTDATGLTALQLGQITFLNPGGYAPGNYSAQLLSTGELVPAAGGPPTLQSTRYGSELVLSWPSGYELLSATNISGPFSPVNGASSPWTNSFSKPMEFFQLRGL